MASFGEVIPITIDAQMWSTAQRYAKMLAYERSTDYEARYVKGYLGELALKDYLRYNRIPASMDIYPHDCRHDNYDIKLDRWRFDVKTQQIHKKMIFAAHNWDNLKFITHEKTIRSCSDKGIDYLFRVILNIDYSVANLIGYCSVKKMSRMPTETKEGWGGTCHVMPVRELEPSWKLLQKYHTRHEA
jgi:hypothetical protein